MPRLRSIRSLTILVSILCFIICFHPLRVGALTLVVTNQADSGLGTLRQAIETLNSDGPGVIDLTALKGDISPATPLPEFARKGEVIGPGPDLLTLSGRSRVRLLSVAQGVELRITGLRFHRGFAGVDKSGSAIQNLGSLTISNCVFDNNLAYGGFGGALYTKGDKLTIQSSLFRTNKVVGSLGTILFGSLRSGSWRGGCGAGMGGALFIEGGEVVLQSCRFLRNTALGGGGDLDDYSGLDPNPPVYPGGRGGGPNGGDAGKPGGFGSGGGGGADGGFGGGGGGQSVLGSFGNTIGKGGYGAGDGYPEFQSAFGGEGPGPGGGGGAFGGAIMQRAGTLLIEGCEFLENSARGGSPGGVGENPKPLGAAFGGALSVIGGSARVVTSSLASNTVIGQSLIGRVIPDSSQGLFFTTVPGFGGAIHHLGGSLQVTASAFVSNVVISGFSGEGYGSAVAITGGAAEFNNTTISGNRVEGAMGVYSGFGSSRAEGGHANGGAICVTNGIVTMKQCTVYDNRSIPGDGNPGRPVTAGSAGIFQSGGVLRLQGTLVGSNLGRDGLSLDEAAVKPAPWLPHDGEGQIQSLGFNLFETTNRLLGLATSDLKNVSPLLGPLGLHGGTTPSYELLEGSAGVDLVPTPFSLLDDQRGIPRPQGALADVGATEFIQGNPTVVTPDRSRSVVIDYGLTTWISLNDEPTPYGSFLWFKNGVALPYQTNAVLVLPYPHLADGGSYERRTLDGTNELFVDNFSVLVSVPVGDHSARLRVALIPGSSQTRTVIVAGFCENSKGCDLQQSDDLVHWSNVTPVRVSGSMLEVETDVATAESTAFFRLAPRP